MDASALPASLRQPYAEAAYIARVPFLINPSPWAIAACACSPLTARLRRITGTLTVILLAELQPLMNW